LLQLLNRQVLQALLLDHFVVGDLRYKHRYLEHEPM
jgi:hypothetical protein